MLSLFWPSVNLAILIIGLVYFCREPLRQFVSSRHTTIREELSRVEEQLRQAQVRYDEFSAKLKAIDFEVKALADQAKQDAEALKVRILSEAKRLSSVIVADAQSSAGALVDDFRFQIVREFGNRVIDRAETIVKQRLTGDERARIRRDFSRQVETIQ